MKGQDYRLYFVDDAGRFCGVRHLEAPDDTTALDLARSALENAAHRMAEVWQLARKVAVIQLAGEAEPSGESQPGDRTGSR